MAPTPIRYSADAIDLTPRVKRSTAVAASPTLAAETTIATLTIGDDEAAVAGVLLLGWAAYTAGTNGVSGQLRLRRTSSAGTLVADSGAVTNVAAALYSPSIIGFDTGPTLPGQVYVLTLTVASASAGSTVSAVGLAAIVA